MKLLSRFSFAILCLLAVSPGCGRKAATQFAAGHELASPLVVQCEAGQRGGRLTLVMNGSPRTFNPLVASDGAPDAVSRFLFGSLVIMDWETQQPGPGLAESWSVEPDQKTWTFKLRPGLRWSDGEPLTADDVVFTWNEVMYNLELNPATFSVFTAGGKPFSVTKVDDVTVRVVTAEPFGPFLEYFAGVWIRPRHKFGPSVQARRFLSAYNLNTPPRDIVGCGPFRLKEALQDGRILLERNPEFWMVDTNGQRLPYFDEVLMYPGADGTAREAFLAGKCDVFESGRSEEYTAFKQASAQGQFQLQEPGAGGDGNFIWFNQNTNVDSTGKPLVQPEKLKWFRNKKFRQAISSAIDRDRIVREVYDGRAKPIYSFMSDEKSRWFNPDAARFPHDPARARALLAEIGLEDRNGDGVLEDAAGVPVRFSLLTNTRNPLRESQARSIADDLKKIGVIADVELLEFRALLEKVNATCDYECALTGLGGGGADPTSQVNVLKSDEPLHQWFPSQPKPSTAWEARVDELMDAQSRTLDVAKRREMVGEVQAILGEEQPMIGTVAPFYFAAFRPDLANVRAVASTAHRVTWNVQELYFKATNPVQKGGSP